MNAPLPEARYTRSHRVYEYAGIALGSSSAVALGWHLAHGARVSLFAGIAAIVVGMLEADLLSGLVHWACDTWGDSQTAVVGPLAIRTFREHHTDERAMLAHDFVETNGHNFALSAIVCAGGWLARAPFVALSLLAAGIFVSMTSQIHKWAHAERPPAVVRLLQRMSVILSPEHHRGHHEDRHTRNYCITTGWLDAPLGLLCAWRGLEALIVRVTGARPQGSTR